MFLDRTPEEQLLYEYYSGKYTPEEYEKAKKQLRSNNGTRKQISNNENKKSRT